MIIYFKESNCVVAMMVKLKSTRIYNNADDDKEPCQNEFSDCMS